MKNKWIHISISILALVIKYALLIAAIVFCWSLTCNAQSQVIKINPSKDTTVIAISVVPTKDTTTPTPPAAGYTLTFASGFDVSGDLDPDNQGQGGNGYIDFAKYLNGPGSFKSRPAKVSSGTRSEVSYTKVEKNPAEGAVEYDVIYNVIVTDGCHSLQWHPNSSSGSAVLSLFHTGGKFDVTLSKAGNNYRQSQDATQPMQTILTNKWYHMRVEYKFANSGAYCRWYIDGKLYFTSKQTFLGDGSGQYFKMGFNGGFWGSQDATISDINYDNLKIYKKN